MAMTIPPVRLRQPDHALTLPFKTLRMLMLGLLLVVGSMLTGCGSGEGGPSASATLTWDPVDEVQGGQVHLDILEGPGIHVVQHGYYVYYGTESQGSSGLCSYPNKVFTSTPSAIVTGLTPNTRYYFAVSAFNGIESECSAEHPADSGDIDPVVIG